MASVTTNLTLSESQALSALVTGGRVANLLTPGGAVNAAVNDILSAAGGVISLVNTANSALSSFARVAINDPITTSYSTGQPYGGTFITSPTTALMTQVDFNQSLISSTQALSQLSLAQQIALSAQTGTVLNNDADLSAALAVQFSSYQSNLKLSFSINLSNDINFVPITVPSTTTTSSYVYITPLTYSPNISALSDFVTQVSISFPNVPGIAGVAASIWVDGLGVSVSSSGTPLTGIPSNIDNGIYGDITNSANKIVSLPTVNVVDYSYQQNQFNLLTALAIDNGLSSTLTSLLGSSLVNNATTQVIKNRLESVARRGDANMLLTMTTILGVNNTPNLLDLLTYLLFSLNPSDQTNSNIIPSIIASGIPITTTSSVLTTAQLIYCINSLFTLLGITINDICNQNTCDSIFCSQHILNVSIMKKINKTILTELLDSDTVNMAYMF